MVKLLRTPPALKYYKLVYDQPLAKKIKFMWSKFEETHPMLAFFGPSAVAIVSGLTAITLYLKLNANPVPKYYNYYVVYRPDDPKVPLIRKDDSLTLGVLRFYNMSGYEAI